MAGIMYIEKLMRTRLFFKKDDQMFYVMIGDQLFKIKATVATAIQESASLEIFHVDDMKQMQVEASKNLRSDKIG